jgi:hypothetical protein
LLPLVIDHGMSVFILTADNPDAIEGFGAEVAPALREAVTRERGIGSVPRPYAS